MVSAMVNLHTALRGAQHSPLREPSRPALVWGAGGWLGAALLTQVLSGGHSRVGAVVRQPMASTHRGLETVAEAQLAAPDARLSARWARATAFVVLERAGLVGARDAAFARVEVAALAQIAQQLRALGAERLCVVVPHAAASLPAALHGGFADGFEQGLSQLGFRQLLLVRSSRERVAAEGSWLERFAALWWAQLRWMLPDDERPLRSTALARVVCHAERALRGVGPGTWLLPQPLASRAAHAREGMDALLQAWAERRSG